MAITYPRDLLAGFDMIESTFSQVESVSLSRSEANRVLASVEWADAYWAASYSTEPIDIADRRRWSAWKSSLRGGLKGFLAWDFMRPFPAAYPNGIPQMIGASPSWNGQGTVASIGVNTIVAAGVPFGFTMTDGDLVGLVENGRRHMFEVAETASAVSGGQITMEVNPKIPLTVFSTAAVVVFYRPKILMVVTPGSFQCPSVGGLANVSWEAEQII